MAKDKSTIRIWLRTDKPNKDNTLPLTLVYQIQGQKKYYWISDAKLPGILGADGKLFSIFWDGVKHRAVFVDKKEAKRIAAGSSFELLTSIEVDEINEKIEGTIKTIRNIEKRFKLDNVPYSISMVIEKLKEEQSGETKKEQPEFYIADFIEKFCRESQDHKTGTLREYKTLMNHMIAYEKLHRVRFTFEGDAEILKGFSSYLSGLTYFNQTTQKTERKLNNITKAKLFSTFKTILRYAKKPPYKYKVNPDYFDYTDKSLIRRDSEFEVIALTQEELVAVYNIDLAESKSLDRARDIFCFSCFTGLRYGDLVQLERKHIRKDNTIVIPASDKNSKRIEVPLNTYSHAILDKYRELRTPLPLSSKTQKLITDQKLNVLIKKVGECAGVDTEIEIVRPYGLENVSLGMFKKYDLLSIHVGRKTFTTLSLEKGIPIQDVMALTTHSTFKAVKRYINVTKERKKTVMAEAWGEVKGNNLKVV